MIDYDDFKKGQKVQLKVYSTDEYSGEQKISNINGTIYQVTKSFVSVKKDKTGIIESFKYSELNSLNDIQPTKTTYNEECEDYKDDIIKDCIKSLKHNKKGIVFNQEQLNQVVNNINRNIEITNKNGIYELK